MFGVIIAALIALVAAACAFTLAAFIGATFFRGGFGLVFAPLGAVFAGVSAFIIALRKLNFPTD